MNDADLLPPPPAGAPTAAERARIEHSLRQNLRAEIRAERRAVVRRDRVATVAVPGLVVACLGAVAALVLVVAGTPSSPPVEAARPIVASGPAVNVLEAASRRLAQTDVLAPTADQFVYVRSVALTNEGAYGGGVDLGDRHTREIWLSQEPGSISDQGLIREFGQDWPLWGGTGSPASIRRPTYAYLASLPSDPDALLDELASQLPTWDDARSTDQVLFDAIVDLVSEGLAPPDTTAALYRALTRIPGVEVDDDARDLLGRPGIGITRTEDVFLTRTVLLIDPSTGETIGARYLMSTPAGDEVFGATAVVARGVADAVGEVPDDPDDMVAAGGKRRVEPA
ncbi:hypothetical protein GHK92_18935 [Nocardioides sp. dk4132]|uniref:CU044_5270 family protein n=1 Tax=unclassified Nocardioides TaxID=2615069 RepID=UPI00129606BE|nr:MULTISPECIES: CU044_5270 family protein [unclassified Nocardioides]MQW77947.1 hypothetical protein [Nocardioides sp. dk4132]QGA09130.1 hypothetical protein GFH29_18310 [Nocardioides sp. dk884]